MKRQPKILLILLGLGLLLAPTADAAPGLITGPGDFHYLGSFRLPAGSFGIDTFSYSTGFVAGNVYRDPAHADTPVLYVSGYKAAGYVSNEASLAKVSIPPLRDRHSVGVENLNSSVVLEGFVPAPSGHNPLNGAGFCSYVVYQATLLAFCGVAYDAGGEQSYASFVDAPSLDASNAAGPYRVGSVPQTMFGAYATLVPAEWRAALGAPVVTGNGPWSIISVNSAGPGLHTVDADALVARPPAHTTIASTPLAYYPIDHQQLGEWNSNLPGQVVNGVPVPTVTVTDPEGRHVPQVGNGGGPIWTIPYNDSAMRLHGMLFADGTSSVLFFGKKGLGPYCYGEGGLGGECYDPDDGSRGDHSYPYSNLVWAYDVQDFIASKNDPTAHPPWFVKPYTGWTMPNDGDLGGVAWDPLTRRIYVVVAGYGPEVLPFVDVYEIPDLSGTAISINDVSVTEGGSGQTSATFTIQLSSPGAAPAGGTTNP